MEAAVSSEYRSNHYVPQWHQRRFIAADARDQELLYLDLHPETFVDGRGTRRVRKALRRQGPRRCFAADDLYTTWFDGLPRRDLERFFFGEVDAQGNRAVQYWATFRHPSVDEPAAHDLLRYLTLQRFRTPRGLAWLAEQAGTRDQRAVLELLQRHQTLYLAIWTECVWQIAEVPPGLDVRLILTDHPVTIYNRSCGPRHQYCRGVNDPDPRAHASHTLFPLGQDRLLILTNHSWATNPRLRPRELRPNPTFYRPTMFDFTSIQVGRQLTSDEVWQINYILKSRAHRYIAAGREEWLHPEEHVSRSDWAAYGRGALLMPDPRLLSPAHEIVVAFDDGTFASSDHQGRLPGAPGYGTGSGGWTELRKWQHQFAQLVGSEYRGSTFRELRRQPSG